MKRDMELIRKILFETENNESPMIWINLDINGYSPDIVSYHVMILDEAGFIKAQNLTTMSSHDWKPVKLTWEGHEFLDAARNDTVWKKAKELIAKNSGSISLAVLKSLLIKISTQELLG